MEPKFKVGAAVRLRGDEGHVWEVAGPGKPHTWNIKRREPLSTGHYLVAEVQNVSEDLLSPASEVTIPHRGGGHTAQFKYNPELDCSPPPSREAALHPAAPFAVGDVVWLRSVGLGDGPPMTVTAVNRTQVETCWFDLDHRLRLEAFPPAALVPAKVPEKADG